MGFWGVLTFALVLSFGFLVVQATEFYSTSYLHFQGEGYVELPSQLFTPNSFYSFTFECWYYLEGTDEFGAEGVKNSKIFLMGSNDYRFAYLSPKVEGDKLRFALARNGETSSMDKLEIITPEGGLWYHVAVTLGPQKIARLYINGRLKDMKSFASQVSDLGNINFAYLGKSTQLSDPLFQGYLDDVRLWRTERTQDQLSRYLEDCVRPGKAEAEGLVALFEFDEEREDEEQEWVANRAARGISSETKDGALKGGLMVVTGARQLLSNLETCMVIGESGFDDFPENGLIGTYKNTWHTAPGHGGFYASGLRSHAGSRAAHVQPIPNQPQEAWLISPEVPIPFEPTQRYKVSFWTYQDIKMDGSRCVDGAMWLINKHQVANQSLNYDSELDRFTNRKWGGSKVWCTEKVRNWTRVETDVTDLVQLNDFLQIHFYFFSEPAPFAEASEGWFIDTVQIIKCAAKTPYKLCELREEGGETEREKNKDDVVQKFGKNVEGFNKDEL